MQPSWERKVLKSEVFLLQQLQYFILEDKGKDADQVNEQVPQEANTHADDPVFLLCKQLTVCSYASLSNTYKHTVIF